MLGESATYSEHTLLANQLDQAIADAALGVALGIGLDVAQVTDVALRIRRRSVGLAIRVVYAVRSASGGSFV